MPNKDGTGPQGKGPKTGRGEGHCEGAQPIEQEEREGEGQGQRQRRGFGRGMNQKPGRNMFRRREE